ncbi:MAG: HD domain-containing protein, partial [Burkholderiales bacterium]|nr:HD domain-containing protein [Burkholderiales bacterium]
DDRLVFVIQDDLAKTLGISAQGERRPSEVLMQRFYRNAATVRNLNSVILQAAIEKVTQPIELEGKSIGDGFLIKGDTLDISSPEVMEKYPYSFVLPFYLKIKYPEITKFSVGILRAFENLDSFTTDQFLADERAKKLFLEILKAKTGTYHALREMAKLGLLSKLLPDWARITGQMQYDLFHAYTVDRHTILAVRYLRHFTRVENAHEMPLCSDLMMGLKDNWRLVVSTLFHDVGKGSGRDHSTVGAEKVREFGKIYGLKPEEIDYISFLVQEHLTMSQVAQKQDISDPEVIKAFATKVGNMERLTGLYLQTVCDIRATSPKIWNGWKARLLEELYYATAEFLKGSSLSKNMLVEKRREEVLRGITLTSEEAEKLFNFWKEFDVAYFMRHSEDAILWHAHVLQGHFDQQKAFVAARKVDGVPNAHEILVLTQDKPELFASIVSSFQFLDLSVLEARIHTGRTGRVLDTFLVIDDGSRPDIEEELKSFTRTLAQKLDSDEPLPPLGRSRVSRQSKYFPITPTANLRPDADGKQFLLSVVAADRRGLLAAIARVFVKYHINLVTARIATLGERVEDVFLLQDQSLHEAPIAAQFEGEILKVLELPKT